MNEILLNNELVENIIQILRKHVLIEDLSTYPDLLLEDVAAYEDDPKLVAEKHRYEVYWTIFNDSTTLKLYQNIQDNEKNKNNIYTTRFYGKLDGNILKIIVPRYQIKRSFYNLSAAGEHEVTNTNMWLITWMARIFGHHKDFQMLQQGDYAILNKSYIKLQVDNEKVLDYQYVEHYTLTVDGIKVSHSNRIDFKKGLDEELSERYTQPLFGKNFFKLSKKELKLLEMYLE